MEDSPMIKILFLASNPIDTPRLELEAEVKAIKEKLRKADQGHLFDVVVEEHVGFEQLKEHLLHHQPEIVHFSGHGNELGRIILEDEGGNAVPASPRALNDLFGILGNDRRIRCVVLNACFSAEQAAGIVNSISCVVGMTREIYDESAAAFAAGFYQGIGFGLSVQKAFELGCNEILSQTEGRPDMDIPRLLPAFGIDPRMYFIGMPRPGEAPNRHVHAKTKRLHGKYSILKNLGTGLISKVDLAFDDQLERHVAVKTLVEPAAKDFFAQEVREIAKIAKHPHIVSIYGGWLDDDPPHYVREYIEGHSLADELASEGRAPIPIDFVHQVLAALGDAMNFAQQLGVWNLGIRPQKVLIQKMTVKLNLGLTYNYKIVICPEIGTSEYIRNVLTGRPRDESTLYFPPEYFHGVRNHADDFDKANQYRLGIIGYEMLVGRTQFRVEAEKQLMIPACSPPSTSPAWPSLSSGSAVKRNLAFTPPTTFLSCPPIDESERARWPSFLSEAIGRMIDPNPSNRFDSLEEAIAAITHRDLDVEIARDSFRRILGKAQAETEFFRTFYDRFLSKSNEIREIFRRSNFPVDDAPEACKAKTPEGKWPDQFRLLKEAIVFLFAYNILREPQEPTVLTRIAQSHCGYEAEYYEYFRDALVETVIEFDKGNYEQELRYAWRKAVEPGLKYMANYSKSHPQKQVPITGQSAGRISGGLSHKS